jgi:hypothetical protein
MSKKTAHVVYELPLRKGGGFYVECKGEEVFAAETFSEVVSWLEAAGVDFTLYRYMDDKGVPFCDDHRRFNCSHPLIETS